MTNDNHRTPRSLRSQGKTSGTAGVKPDPEDGMVGTLTTQTGPRTTAPMWARPLLTLGEWAVYTALWSFANWNGSDTFPTHRTLSDRAWVEPVTAKHAVRRFAELGIVVRTSQRRPNNSATANAYMLLDVCPAHLAERIADLAADRKLKQKP